MDLGAMVDRIQTCSDVLKRHGYVWDAGGGEKAWSVRYTNAEGRHIDTRASEWTGYDAEGKELNAGFTIAELETYLAGVQR